MIIPTLNQINPTTIQRAKITRPNKQIQMIQEKLKAALKKSQPQPTKPVFLKYSPRVEDPTVKAAEKIEIAVKKEVKLRAREDKSQRTLQFIKNIKRSAAVKASLKPNRQEELKTAYGSAQSLKAEVLNFDISQPHPMPVESYLDNRLSRTVIDLCKQDNNDVEIFIGSNQDLFDFYASQGLDHIGEIESQTSTDFHIFKSPIDDKLTIVASNIGSNARLEHQGLQFKFAGIKVEDVKVRGSVDAFIKKVY